MRWLARLDGTDAIQMQTTKGIIIILHITWDRWNVVAHGNKVVDHYAALSLFKHHLFGVNFSGYNYRIPTISLHDAATSANDEWFSMFTQCHEDVHTSHWVLVWNSASSKQGPHKVLRVHAKNFPQGSFSAVVDFPANLFFQQTDSCIGEIS